MQTVILCGGKGTRLSEETQLRPKPMVAVGRHPILWHIMKYYGSYGFNDFTLATGYLGDYIKNYFLHYAELNSDFEVDLSSGKITGLQRGSKEDWKVRLIDTGPDTLTGGRLLRLKSFLKDTFFFTYGDGLCDVDLNELLKFHKKHGKLATITAVRPTARFGGIEIHDDGSIKVFREKLPADENFINGGFMVLEPGVFKYLQDDETILERQPMEKLAQDGQLMAFQHQGFWQCMDTIRDREVLDEQWSGGKAPWKRWD
ncbi:MAG TPA: glucose-1-phosphate cytidylyltransferase [Bdellovibrionota bacterium]|jgi:glucose-1-phosphate cytidylyltransferase